MSPLKHNKNAYTSVGGLAMFSNLIHLRITMNAKDVEETRLFVETVITLMVFGNHRVSVERNLDLKQEF